MNENKTDLIIVGAGPSGLTGAIYTTREGIDTLVFEKGAVGGNAAITDRIENYPGFPEGITGLELSEKLKKQAVQFGAKLLAGVEVKKVSDEGEYKRVATSEGDFLAKAVLFSLGTYYKQLEVPGEKENIGRGIHFCATCDAPFYKNKEILVIGGGNAALQESLFLTKFASRITMLVRDVKFKGSDVLIAKVMNEPKITVEFGVISQKVERVGNTMKLTTVEKSTGVEKIFEANGVFVFIGLIPQTQFLKDSDIELDERGFIKTDSSYMTNMKGVFASGDCREGSTFQIASAVGEGAVVALRIRRYLEG